MNIFSRKSSAGLLALSAALMMPLAFAQSTSPSNTASQSDSASPPAAASIPQTTNPAAGTTTAQSANTPTAQSSDTTSSSPVATAPATKSGSGGQKTWEELDTNKDGNLSKAEAAADPSMKAVFDKADANGDGILTPDEYRAYYAKYQANAARK
ncbi:MAG TPA: hypothetical protein VK753_04985 [Xanthomonadaceae bacterium]|jgi:hypothetical protein|nr:hypothetical protein [Xanthomonadaceae bacterium]